MLTARAEYWVVVLDWKDRLGNCVHRDVGKAIRTRLVDEAIEGYVRWREDCAAVRDAYSRWASVPREDRAGAFVAYTEALDREERSARAYALLIGRVIDSGARA
jgi:hypothetical protein